VLKYLILTKLRTAPAAAAAATLSYLLKIFNLNNLFVFPASN